MYRNFINHSPAFGVTTDLKRFVLFEKAIPVYLPVTEVKETQLKSEIK
jgi:hypothetical protein